MEEIKLPKYIVKELSKASDYVNKSNKCIEKFEQWVKENVDENFDFDTLRAMSHEIDDELQTEALTEVEYGNGISEDEIERVLNVWVKKNK